MKDILTGEDIETLYKCIPPADNPIMTLIKMNNRMIFSIFSSLKYKSMFKIY